MQLSMRWLIIAIKARYHMGYYELANNTILWNNGICNEVSRGIPLHLNVEATAVVTDTVVITTKGWYKHEYQHTRRVWSNIFND